MGKIYYLLWKSYCLTEKSGIINHWHCSANIQSFRVTLSFEHESAFKSSFRSDGALLGTNKKDAGISERNSSCSHSRVPHIQVNTTWVPSIPFSSTMFEALTDWLLTLTSFMRKAFCVKCRNSRVKRVQSHVDTIRPFSRMLVEKSLGLRFQKLVGIMLLTPKTTFSKKFSRRYPLFCPKCVIVSGINMVSETLRKEPHS